MLKISWEDDHLSRSCFDWLKEWKTIAAEQELYQQLLPTKLYHHKKTGINTSPDVLCRMCGKCPESVPHILSGCSTSAQTKYTVPGETQLSLEDSVLRNASRTELGIQGTTHLSNLNQCTRMKELGCTSLCRECDGES